MKEGYSIKTIKDICKKESSNIAQKDIEGVSGKYPIYGAGGIIQCVNFYHQEHEYIGVVKDGSGIGRVMFLPPKSSVIGTLQYIIPQNRYNIRYIGYCLQGLKLERYKKGAAIPHIYFRDYGEASVLIANDTAEQQRIVEILDAEFAKIDALKANAEKSLQAAKDLFQSILKQELTPKDNWVHCELKDVCQFFNGKPHENNIDPNGEYILVNSKFIASDMRVYKKTGTQLFPLYKDDIVMVMSDVPKGQALAKCQIIDKDKTYSLNQRICVFRNSSINIHFLYYLINRNPYLLAFDNGENQTNLRKNDIITMPISYPKETSEMDDIIEKLDLMNERCKALQENYRKTIALCEDLKQALLRKAFNGEL